MGLALDEPKDGDEKYEIGDLPFVIDPFASKIIKDSGGLTIKNSFFGPIVELANSTGGCG